VSTNTLHRLARELGEAFLPLEEATQSAEAFGALARDLGWNLEDIPPPIRALSTAVGRLRAALEQVLGDSPSPEDFEALVQALRDLVAAIDGLSTAGFDPALAAAGFATTFPRQLVQYLIIEHLTRAHPRVAFALTALGVLRVRYVEAPATEHLDHVQRELVWADIAGLLADPVQIFENVYGWRTADFTAERVFQNVLDLMAALGWRPSLEEIEGATAGRLQENASEPRDRAPVGPNLVLFRKSRAGAVLAGGVRLLALPARGPRLPGLALVPYLTGQLEEGFALDPRLVLAVTSSLNVQGGLGVKLRPGELEILQGLEDPDGAAAAQGHLTVSLVNREQSGDPLILLGSADESRLEYRALALQGGLRVDGADAVDLYAELALQRAALIVKPGTDDGFLRHILPEKGVSAEFEVAVGLSRLTGFYLRGSAGLEVQIPVHRALGPVELEAVTLAVKLRPGESTVRLELGASVKAELGPLTAVVENMGLAAAVSFPADNRGNLGPLGLDVDFKPPAGVGLSIEGQGFSGGGFLKFEPDDHRYVGALELEFRKVALKAIGLLTTRLPGDTPGFSLLVILTADFTPPIQLGLGFTLSAVGGLLGLNRTVRVERLRSGLQDATLSSVLFPTDVVANASRIISDLQEVFPPQADRFLFGPMARINWGSPPLITADVGLALEIPDPVRLVVLGVVRALLPDAEKKLLRLQVNFLGVVDFDKQQVAFDATLYDSKLLSFTLAGDMAFRFNGGSDPNLLLTVGGFHPAYQPPPLALPALRRLTVQLLAGSNPRLTLETYFAITANTVQFGARLELLATAGPFDVYGFLAFDVLLQFNPFYLVAEVNAMLALRRGSSSIASIKLELTLEGPTPWKARGTASFKICWFLTIKVRFSRTFGEALDTRQDDVAVLPLLRAALADPGNWRGERPAASHGLVAVKPTGEPGGLVVEPIGVLALSQKVVPLNVRIDTFGHRHPVDGDTFAIHDVTVGGRSVATDPIQEQFAPAQFFTLTDAEKLSRRSFERYDAGVRVTSTDGLDGDHYVRRDVVYELSYIDSQRSLLPAPDPVSPFPTAFGRWASGGAIARSPLSGARTRPSALAPDAVTVRPERFTVVRARDLSPLARAPSANSESEARSAMRRLIAQDPTLAGELEVVPAFEAVGLP
jgi:hypothetical protein